MSDSIRLLAYMLLLGCSLLAANGTSGAERRWLFGVSILASCLAVALALSAAGTVADFGRATARDEGWYQDRRSVQALAIVVIGAIGLLTVVSLWFGLRRRSLPLRMTGAGVIVLLSYLVARSISLHQVDAVLSPDVGHGIRRGDVIEIAIVGCLSALVLAVGVPSRAQPKRDARSATRA